MSRSVAIPISDSSRVGEARRLGSELARSVGVSEAHAARVRLVITEAAGNLSKHAREGKVVLRPLQGPDGVIAGIEVMTIDRGPGMKDMAVCLQDGFSTAGSPGTGLGSIQRTSDVFDIFSQPETGTVLVSQIWTQRRPKGPSIEIGAVCLPMEENTRCGDAWESAFFPERLSIVVADGLGHGPLAADAADEMLKVFAASKSNTPEQILQAAHGPLRHTRGASVSIAEIWHAEQSVRFVGVGNVSGAIMHAGGTRRMVSHNGTLGHELHRLQEFHYPWSEHGVLVMHTDGLQTRWNLDLYPRVIQRHPSVIAGVLYRDFQRLQDDTTVVVVRNWG